MKQTIKFVVAVFGVTVATLGTLQSKATVRCSGSTGTCAKVQLANGTVGTMVGARGDVAQGS